MVQAGESQAVYESMSQYHPRQAAAVEVLATQFGVPHYAASNEQSSAAMSMAQSQYMTSQADPVQYGGQITASAQDYAGQTPSYGVLQSQDVSEHAATTAQQQTMTEGLRQYREKVRLNFELIKLGQLNEAAVKVSESSRWLLTNIGALGKDNHALPEYTTDNNRSSP